MARKINETNRAGNLARRPVGLDQTRRSSDPENKPWTPPKKPANSAPKPEPVSGHEAKNTTSTASVEPNNNSNFSSTQQSKKAPASKNFSPHSHSQYSKKNTEPTYPSPTYNPPKENVIYHQNNITSL